MDRINKKKIVHVLKSSIYSGAENVVLTIINNIQDEFNFVYIATEGPIREKLEQEHVPFRLLSEFKYENLKKVLEEEKPDIIHAHDFSATVMCALCGKYRIISHLHYDPPWARRWNFKTAAYVCMGRRIARILAVSGGAYHNLIFSDMFQAKMSIIGNPIDKERILYMGGKEQLPIYDLLFVGRLVEQKAPQMFIEIVGKLKQSGRSIKCAMVGTGDLEKMCRELIEQNGLQSSIELLGFQENPYLYMRMSKLLCMTSRWEGYGLVAAEANILGIPVLSTKTGGVTELFGEKAEELCNGSDDFFEKIQKLLSDSELYQIWKMRALKRAKEFTSPKEYSEKLSLIYKKEMMNQ